jgi:restriction endonuclease Mrr
LDASVWAVQNLLVQIQAKRWLHTVGRKEVAELRGSLQPHAAGCIVTTSQFSCAALVESRAPGKVPITVINGLELAGLTHAANMALD